MDKNTSKRREFIKDALLKTNSVIFALHGFKESILDSSNFDSGSHITSSGIVYQNDFTANLNGISHYAVLNLRISSGSLKFNSTRSGRGIFIGPTYSQENLQRWLVIKINNPGLGLNLYTQQGNESSYVQTLSTTAELVVPFVTSSPGSDNRLFLATTGPEYDISIDYIKIFDVNPDQVDEGLWVGTYQTVINNRRYTWIPSRDADIDVQPNGNVVLICPATKMSLNGTNTCNRFVYDENYQHLGSGYLSTLLGSGVNLPDGNYHFLIHYFNSNSYEEVDLQPWNMASNPNTYQSNSGRPEAVSFSIETMDGLNPPNKVNIPPDQERVSWLITNQYLPTNLNLPPFKDFGITRLHWDIVSDDTAESLNRVYTKVTHIQFAGRAELVAINANKKWDCVMGTGMTSQQVADSQPSETNYIMMSQLKEQGHTNTSLEAAFQLTYQKLQNEKGVTTPNQTKLYCDYFADADGYGMGGNFLHGMNQATRKLQLSSEIEARKIHTIEGHPTSAYFSQNCFNYRNRSIGGYLDSYQRIPGGSMVFQQIMGYEKGFIAIDRNAICMSWADSEGVNSETTRVGVKYRLKLPSGDLIRRNVIGLPAELMKTQSFFSLLLGESYVLWANSENLVKNPMNWDKSLFTSEIEFQATGSSSPSAWQDGNPTHPQPTASSVIVNSRGTHFPNSPLIGEQGAWTGAYLYSQISFHSDRVSQNITPRYRHIFFNN